jgi:hypothetical protein
MPSVELERRKTGSAMNLAEMFMCLAAVLMVCFGVSNEAAPPAVRTAEQTKSSKKDQSAHKLQVTGERLLLDGAAAKIDAIRSLSGAISIIVSPATTGVEVARVLSSIRERQNVTVQFEEPNK